MQPEFVNASRANRGSSRLIRAGFDICEWVADGDDLCSGDCTRGLGLGDQIWFLSDGGYDSREGSYYCRRCAFGLLRPFCVGRRRPLVGEEVYLTPRGRARRARERRRFRYG